MDIEAEVRALLERVPRSPDHPAPGGADPAEIEALGGRLGMPLPAELAAWLAVCRGEPIACGGVYGIRPDLDYADLEAALALQPEWLDSGWLPVAGDGCGNHYVLLTKGPRTGFVGFIDTAADPDRIDYLVASGLWRFLRFLFEEDLGRKGWPFDRNLVLAEDPNLTTAPADLLPWNV
jgi:cell wall assembly regulator SMI1